MTNYRIVQKIEITPAIFQMVIDAPLVARKCLPGQFVILRVNDTGERIPLTIADFDRTLGTIAIFYLVVGKTTALLSQKRAGEFLSDVAGPLGEPSPIKNFGTVACVGGGIGVAAVFPIARALREAGNNVIGVIGAKTATDIIMEDDMRAACNELLVATNDGSKGHAGFVTDVLLKLIRNGTTINHIVSIGPVPMMRAVSDVTRPFGIKTMVSLNPIMVDGTGMCGGCRVPVDGQTKFACVDGPEFDGHLVDFERLAKRLASYQTCERLSKSPSVQ